MAAFAELAAARQEAAHGEWGLWLQEAGVNDATARAQLQLYEQFQADPRFADRFRGGWLGESAGRELLSAPAEVQEEILSRPAESPRPTVAEVREAKREVLGGGSGKARGAAPNRATSHDLPKDSGAAPTPPRASIEMTPLTPLTPTPTGAPTVLASIPGAAGLPPMLQLGAPSPSTLPPSLFPPATAPNPAPADEFAVLQARMRAIGSDLLWEDGAQRFAILVSGVVDGYYPSGSWDGCKRRAEYLFAPVVETPEPPTLSAPPAPEGGEWVEVVDDDGPTVMLRSSGLSAMVADAVAQVAEALRLIALGHAHAVDTELLGDIARSVGSGALCTVLRLVADEADEHARRASAPAVLPAKPTSDAATWETVAPGLGDLVQRLEKAERTAVGPLTRKHAAAELERDLTAFVTALDEEQYEVLAHRIGALRKEKA
jgi:hypothetical protein